MSPAPIPRDAALIDRYRAGESTVGLAAAFAISRQRVHQILRQHGVATRNTGQLRIDWTPEMDAALARLTAQGLGYSRAAHLIGVSELLCRQRRGQLGLAAGRPGRPRLTPSAERTAA